MGLTITNPSPLLRWAMQRSLRAGATKLSTTEPVAAVPSTGCEPCCAECGVLGDAGLLVGREHLGDVGDRHLRWGMELQVVQFARNG